MTSRPRPAVMVSVWLGAPFASSEPCPQPMSPRATMRPRDGIRGSHPGFLTRPPERLALRNLVAVRLTNGYSAANDPAITYVQRALDERLGGLRFPISCPRFGTPRPSQN